MSGDVVRLTAWVHGYVQGVGFRWWVYGQANELGLSGSATNLYRRPGSVRSVIDRWSEPRGVTDFRMC